MITEIYDRNNVNRFDLQLFAEGDPPPGDPPKDPPKNDPPQDPPKDPPKDEKKYDEAYVQRLQREAAEQRAEAKKHKDELDKIEAQKLKDQGEYEKLAKKAEKERDDAIAAHKEEISKRDQRYIASELKSAAVEAGIIDADLIRLVDMDIVKMNADGNVEGVKTAIEALKTSKPHLFKTQEQQPDTKTQRGKNDPPPRQQSQSQDKPVDARTLSDDDFNKLWDTKSSRRA